MQHFVSINHLTRHQLETLIDRSLHHAQLAPGSYPQQLGHISVASLFFENSTRTRVSFELAAQRLGAHHVALDLASSSQQKGESVWDTVATLQAMGIVQFIVRTSEVGLPAMLAERVNPNVGVINAGEAHLSHPSQALLDLVTLTKHKGAIDKLSIAIVGDLAHSRVARSFVRGARLLGCTDLRLVAPTVWQGSPEEFAGLSCGDNLDLALEGIDVVMALRIQKERMQDATQLHIDEYRAQFGLSSERLQRCRPDLMVMHPGPFNRNIELTDEVADGAQSVILEQVAFGVPARMAIIETLALHAVDPTSGVNS